MAPQQSPAKYSYVVTSAGPKILPVEEPFCKDEESPADYNAGGYLPVKLSDSFKNNRYKVVRKLGWGHFSTVWLVKDTHLHRHSALKVVKSAGRYAETARDEIKLLSRVASFSPAHPGRQHIVSFLDSFTHQGPEASHICIVFEPLGENLLALIERNKKHGVPRALVKVIAKQTLLGLQYLHDECDLVHTDIKPENILISIPDIEAHISTELSLSPSPTSRRVGVPLPSNIRSGLAIRNQRSTRRSVQIFDSQPLSSPSRSAGIHGSSMSFGALNSSSPAAPPPTPSSPTSLSTQIPSPPPRRETSQAPQPMDIPSVHPSGAPPLPPPLSIKIADLGNATPSKKHYTEDIQTRQYRAPEAILGRKDWDVTADIWSVACVVFELLTAEYLFDPQGQGELFTKDDDHMAQIIELLGDFSIEAKMGGKYSRELFDHTGALRYIRSLKPWPLKRVMMEKYLYTDRDATILCDFLEPMLVIDMKQRSHARDMIDHRWLDVVEGDEVAGSW
ncbi:kinase-like domain-containing protein [Desarmillaria tabescens]|uniref:non-specific serine/threonine protein kinase n=1 Tax=Armillaria tabescens TaxID=1929756 RepID=A0AA39NGL6_ARMTA|nr:kinase-like domain-containing protein [Desarmillaria tabescens]KAK0465261.1 kinase-like domain-containing protein [Desarmillaria tabescens]